MKNTTMKKNYDFNGKQVTVNYASSLPAGYGHREISVELECDGNATKFSATTNNMMDFDAANDLEGQEKYEAFFDIIKRGIESSINEWIESL